MEFATHSCLREHNSCLALLEENTACLDHVQDVYVRGTGSETERKPGGAVQCDVITHCTNLPLLQ